jgi:hypothetical protein
MTPLRQRMIEDIGSLSGFVDGSRRPRPRVRVAAGAAAGIGGQIHRATHSCRSGAGYRYAEPGGDCGAPALWTWARCRPSQPVESGELPAMGTQHWIVVLDASTVLVYGQLGADSTFLQSLLDALFPHQHSPFVLYTQLVDALRHPRFRLPRIQVARNTHNPPISFLTLLTDPALPFAGRPILAAAALSGGPSNPRQSPRPKSDLPPLRSPARQRQRDHQIVMFPAPIRSHPHPSADPRRRPHVRQLPHQRTQLSQSLRQLQLPTLQQHLDRSQQIPLRYAPHISPLVLPFTARNRHRRDIATESRRTQHIHHRRAHSGTVYCQRAMPRHLPIPRNLPHPIHHPWIRSPQRNPFQVPNPHLIGYLLHHGNSRRIVPLPQIQPQIEHSQIPPII